MTRFKLRRLGWPQLLLGLTILALAAISSSCVFPAEPPGVGNKAENGYQLCAPIIEALAKYQAQQGAYPQTLDALIPVYLSGLPTEDVLNWGYRLTEIGYELEFRYTGPGMNICDYVPGVGWRCHGYF